MSLRSTPVRGGAFAVLLDAIAAQHEAVGHHQRGAEQVPRGLVVLEPGVLRVHRVQPVAALS